MSRSGFDVLRPGEHAIFHRSHPLLSSTDPSRSTRILRPLFFPFLSVIAEPQALPELVQPILLYIGCALGALGVTLALPRRGTSPQVVGGLIVGAAVGAIFLAMGLANVDRLPNINFYVFSFIAVGAALRVVSHPRPVYSALYFILTILASSGLYVILAAEFMAFALIIVYAGAILITYLFVIMLATESPTEEQEEALQEYDRYSREPLAATIVGFVLLATLTTIMANGSSQLVQAPGIKGYEIASQKVNLGSGEMDDTHRISPFVAATIRADRPMSLRVRAARGSEVIDLDPNTLETGMPIKLEPGENSIAVPFVGMSDEQAARLDVWFTPASAGDLELLAQLPGRLKSGMSEARSADNPKIPLMREDEWVRSIDLSSRTVTLTNHTDTIRVVPLPADLEVNNVEGVAFTLLNEHPGAIEIAGVILLMAMLGAVVLARKKVEMDDAAKFAAQQRSLVVVDAGPVAPSGGITSASSGGKS